LRFKAVPTDTLQLAAVQRADQHAKEITVDTKRDADLGWSPVRRWPRRGARLRGGDRREEELSLPFLVALVFSKRTAPMRRNYSLVRVCATMMMRADPADANVQRNGVVLLEKLIDWNPTHCQKLFEKRKN
jgi:hypothetical protein